jgi:hypothetical protein
MLGRTFASIRAGTTRGCHYLRTRPESSTVSHGHVSGPLSGGEFVGEQPVVQTDGVVPIRTGEPGHAPSVFAVRQDPLGPHFLRAGVWA